MKKFLLASLVIAMMAACAEPNTSEPMTSNPQDETAGKESENTAVKTTDLCPFPAPEIVRLTPVQYTTNDPGNGIYNQTTYATIIDWRYPAPIDNPPPDFISLLIEYREKGGSRWFMANVAQLQETRQYHTPVALGKTYEYRITAIKYLYRGGIGCQVSGATKEILFQRPYLTDYIYNVPPIDD